MCSSMHVSTPVTQLLIFFPLEQMKKGKTNTGTMSEARSMENVFDHFVKDAPQGPTGAKSKEKPGRHQPLKRKTIHISIAKCHCHSHL